MGIFDTVYVDCECGYRIYDQIKWGGECMGHYSVYGAPNDVKAALNGYDFVCLECDKSYTIHTTVVMQVIVKGGEDDT